MSGPRLEFGPSIPPAGVESCTHPHGAAGPISPGSEIDKLHTRIRELEDEISSVRAEAVEAVEFWGEFASKYSKAKHGLASDIARLKGTSE